MSTAAPAEHHSHGTLYDWIRYNPHQIGYLRLALFAVSLVAMGAFGMRWANPAPPEVDNETEQCTYAAARYDPPAEALYAVVSHTFQIDWKIQNTGSCHVWGEDILFVRRNDDIPSQTNAYPAPTQPVITTGDNPTPIVVAYVTTVMTAPPTSGVYMTEWYMRAPNGRRFGPIMQQRVQVAEANSPVPPPIPNEPPPAPGTVLLVGLLSFTYHLLPALLGIIFILWRANDFMTRLFQLPATSTAWRHVISMMFGVMPGQLYVQEGKLQPDPSNKAAETIGGPAWLTVADYSAALLEHGGGFARIVGPGSTYLHPHERVRGTVDLQAQHRRVREKTMTKDGIPIELDVDLVFRIAQKDMPADVPVKPPPLGLITRLKKRLGLPVNPALLEASREHRFSREAVRRAVYEATVFSPDRLPDWAFSFSMVRAGDVSDQMADMRLDELSAPEDLGARPLREIQAKGLETARSWGAQQGIDVLDMTMGAIEMPKGLAEQIISNWQVIWRQRAKALVAEGEAKATQLKEEARAEAQANMIQALTEGFRIAISDSESKDVAGQVIALRFIDTLEALMQGSSDKEAKDKRPDLGLVVS
jgi:hypothetical protein